MTLGYPSKWWDRFGDREQFNKIKEIIDAVLARVQKSGDTMTGDLNIGDTDYNIRINADTQKIEMGDRSSAWDINLYRRTANVLASEHVFSIIRGAGESCFWIEQPGDTQRRFYIGSNGSIYWGPGDATQDVLLKRGGANILQTADHFYPTGQGVCDQGSDTVYWGDINYKTLNDRGCPAWIEPKNALQQLRAIEPDPAEKSIHKSEIGVELPSLRKSSLPAMLRDTPTEARKQQVLQEYQQAYADWLKAKDEFVPSMETPVFMEPEPQYFEPVEALRFDLLVYMMLSTLKELDNRLSKIEQQLGLT